MRARTPPSLLLLLIVASSACGGLENEPLSWGLVRGSLLGASASASVSVFGRPELIASPDRAGNFSLRVPQGEADLLALISDTNAERIPVEVHDGLVVDLGARSGLPPGVLELELKAPGFQALTRGTASVDGTPLSIKLEEVGEWIFRLPAGCYQVVGSVPGLGTITTQGCAVEGTHSEVEFRFPRPDGSPGREGCVVTGCVDALVCHADGSCGF